MDFRIRVNKLFEFFYQRSWIAPRRMSMIAHPLAPGRRLEQVSLHQGRRSLLEKRLLVLRAENAQPSVDRNRRRYDLDTGVGRRSRFKRGELCDAGAPAEVEGLEHFEFCEQA